jgi:Holliday junction resolvasome RuvABC DNA-binding subunit
VALSSGSEGFSAGVSSVASETISALESLGYRKNEAQTAVQKAIKEGAGSDVSTLLKSALRLLSK